MRCGRDAGDGLHVRAARGVTALASMAGTARQGGSLIGAPILLLIVGIGFFLACPTRARPALGSPVPARVGVPRVAGLDQVVWSGSWPRARRCLAARRPATRAGGSPRWGRQEARAHWRSTCSASSACSPSRLRARSRSHSPPSGAARRSLAAPVHRRG